MPFLKNIRNGNISDNDLLSAYKRTGQLEYLGSLYQRYMDLVFGVCLKYFNDIEQSKDGVLDIFEELTSKLRHHHIENFRGWLHILTKNYCLMKLRSPRNLKIVEWNPGFMQNGAGDHLSDDVFEKEEKLNQLENCIKSLAPEQKQSIELFYLRQKCYNEIALITGFDWNKVRSYIQNGKRNLKICMDEKELQNKT